MKVIKIKKNSLELEINNEKANANEIIKDIWANEKLISVQMQLTTFFEKYNELTNDISFRKQNDVNVLLSICNFPNPNIDFGLDLNSNIQDINKAFEDYKNNNTVIYKVTTVQELLSVILYHYISNGYKLKNCVICDNFFLEKDYRVSYCSEKCKKRSNSKKEIERRKKDEIAHLYKLTYSMLDNRGDEYFDNFKLDYKRNKMVMSKKELKKWLEQTHKSLKRR